MGRRTSNQLKRDRERKLIKDTLILKAGGNSNYAKKKAWLRGNATLGVESWGFQILSPKPWK